MFRQLQEEDLFALEFARACAVAFAAAAMLGGGPAAAQTAPTYLELLRRAEATLSPRLAVADAEVRAAQGRALQAGVRPNPTIGLEVENFAGTGPFEGLRGSETTLSASQTLEIFGQRGARMSAAQADVEAARARVTTARIGLAHDLASAYAEAEAGQQRLAAAEEALNIAQADARVTRTLVDAGREPAVRAVQAAAAAAAAEAELEGVRADLAEALSSLAALSGSAEPIAAVSPGLLDQVAEAGSFDSAQAPAIRQARAERDAAARRLRVEQLRGRPDPTVTLGVRRLQMEESTALVAGVSAPLPLFDRNRGATQAARAELQAADARLRQAELEAETEARSAAARFSASQRRLTAALTGEVAAAEAHRAARIGYEAGRFPLTDVLTARRGLTDAREQTIEARLARARAQAALARLQGRRPFGADQ